MTLTENARDQYTAFALVRHAFSCDQVSYSIGSK